MPYGTLLTDTIKSSTSGPVAFQNTSGTEVGTLCRAWVNFNGTSTVAIRASFNVSSITDNGTGDYTVNFTNALSDANYAVSWSASNDTVGSNSWSGGPQTRTTTAIRLAVQASTNAAFLDASNINVSVFR